VQKLNNQIAHLMDNRTDFEPNKIRACLVPEFAGFWGGGLERRLAL
jgi:hypothetical protein